MADTLAAIVTGAAQGLGAAICRALLKQGYKVCVTDVQETKGKTFVQQLEKEFGSGEVIFSLCDVSKEEDLKRTFDFTVKTFKTVNLLVNNAGIVWEQNPRKTIDVNLMGPIFGCQLALKYMGKTCGGKGGVVINIASLAGFLPSSALPCYHASKHAVIGLTRSYGGLYVLFPHATFSLKVVPSLQFEDSVIMADLPVAIVTGGAQGIGAAIVKALLHKGYRVCIADLQETKGSIFVDSLNKEFGADRTIFALCDVTKEEDIERAFELTINKFQHVDVLVNNAGIACEENPRKTIEVNVMGPIFGCQLALKYMGTSNGGKGGLVVNTASISGFLPNEALSSYTASKHAVIGLTRCYGLPYHLSRNSVIFSAICPHFVDTDILNNARNNPIDGLAVNFIEKHLMTADYVAQGFIKVLEEKINGSTLVITKEHGYQYVGLQEEVLKMAQ